VNNVDDYIKKTEMIPDKDLRNCAAMQIFTENNVRVFPISHHSDPDVNNASAQLIQTHFQKFGNMRILGQVKYLFSSFNLSKSQENFIKHFFKFLNESVTKSMLFLLLCVLTSGAMQLTSFMFTASIIKFIVRTIRKSAAAQFFS
jgi:hypothetical protein